MPGVSAQMGSRPPSALPALPHARSGVPRIPPHPPTPPRLPSPEPFGSRTRRCPPGSALLRCCASAIFVLRSIFIFLPPLPPTPPLPRLPPRSFRLRKNPKGKTTRPQIRGGGAPAGEIYGIQRTGTAQGIFCATGFAAPRTGGSRAAPHRPARTSPIGDQLP